MTNACLYKGELASPSRYMSLFTTFLTHYFSVSLLTWASERYVPEGTFRPTAKTHRHRAGSSYSHTGAFSATVTTQPSSLDRSNKIFL